MSNARVVVVGGGLAGISAAITLAEARVPVTVLEARPWLGGATWSFGRRGLTVDNGQHIFTRAFTSYLELLDRLGVTGSVCMQDRLEVMVLDQDRPPVRIRRSRWPAPLHLAGTAARYRPLPLTERLRVLPAALAMWLSDMAASGQDRASIADWLARHWQNEHARAQFWDTFLVPFLNAPSEQSDLGTAAALINAVLLSGRGQADLGVPLVPLQELHGAPAVELLAELGAEVRVGAQVTGIRREPGGRFTVRVGPAPAAVRQEQLPLGLENPDLIRASGVVLAVPPAAAAELAPAELAEAAARWGRLQAAPAVSLHVTYESRVTRLPFALTTGPGLRWIADRTAAAGLHSGQYLAATVPAAWQYVDLPAASLREQFLPQFERLFPAAAAAKVEDFFVTRERSATFLPAPGTRTLRPGQATRLRGFAVAGAWTSTGWPDTMEGAVRSGRLAAKSLLRSFGAASPMGRRGSVEAVSFSEDDTPTAAMALTDALAAELAAARAAALESEPASGRGNRAVRP